MDSKKIRDKKGFIIDMDGVIYHGNYLLPGVKQFVDWLQAEKKDFIFLTNSSQRAPRELKEKLQRLGIDVAESHFYTSALATAIFLSKQKPNGSAYVIGESGLINALYDVGYSINEINPDYVVVGESRNYNFEKIEHAVHLINAGAKLIGTNPDLTGPTEKGLVPATRALISPIELTTGKQAYFIGKPNPLMMRHALLKLGTTSGETIIIGDRMDTDIIAGIESEIEQLLVLSGVSCLRTIEDFPYRPTFVMESVGDILEGI
jgi:NagD protein